MKNNICPICGSPTGRNSVACSRKCYNLYRSNKKTCVICGKEFYSPPSSETKTCSKECSSENHRRLMDQYKYILHEKSVKSRMKDPRFQKDENYIRAKTWIIMAPDGTIYKCRNLLHWCRTHEDLYEGTCKQAWDGLTKIKYSKQGKRKRGSSQWKGWTLLGWGE